MTDFVELDAEVIKALRANPNGLDCKGLFALCKTAGHTAIVSGSINRLRDDGVIAAKTERHGNKGAIYVLSANANAILDNKLATALQAEITQAVDHVAVDAVIDGVDVVDHFDVIMKSLVAIKSAANAPRVVDDLDIKLQTLDKIALLFNDEIAETLHAIYTDLDAA